MGPVRPPASAAIAAVVRREEQGFDAVWWADHFLHWFPTSIWTPDLVPQAQAQASPHVWFDPYPMIAAAGVATSTIKLGVGVTDLVRRHPVALAQTALTLDHLTKGRFLLGVGTGETANIQPVGLDNDRPLSRLAEGLRVIRQLFATHEPIDFDGEFFTLRAMSLGLRPVDAPPPIWVAAHRPRGLTLVGEMADGWLPLATDPAEYTTMLAAVHAAAARAGRAPDAITPAAYIRIVVADTTDDARRAVDESLLMRFIALTRPAEAFATRGAVHPLGEHAFGLTSLLPTEYDRESALAMAAAVPAEVVRDTVIFGTPDEVADRVRAFVDAGARHVQLTNMTPMTDPTRAASSEALMGDVVSTLRSAATHA